MYYSGKNIEPSSMYRQVVVNTSQVLDFLETAMGDHLGTASQYLNLKSIVYQLVENRISGDILASCSSIKKQLTEYGLPVDWLNVTFDSITTLMNALFNLHFEYDIQEYVCNFKLIRRGDVVIDVLSDRNSLIPLDTNHLIQIALEEAEDNGDYVPERIRHIAKSLR